MAFSLLDEMVISIQIQAKIARYNGSRNRLARRTRVCTAQHQASRGKRYSTAGRVLRLMDQWESLKRAKSGRVGRSFPGGLLRKCWTCQDSRNARVDDDRILDELL